MTKVKVSRRGRIAVLRIANPPVNALSIAAGVVAALHDAIGRVMTDDEVDAIIIAGENGLFSAGADITDFETNTDRLDYSREVTERIEQASKPVVAALHGVALGGALELALGAHYRICARGTKLGLPEINLGLLPGGGATQRLPRLIGAAPALELMVSGKPMTAEQALASGLVDQVVDGDVVEAAIAFILRCEGLTPRRTGSLPVPADLEAAVAQVRAKIDPRALSQSAARIADCVEAASRLDLVAGLAFEAEKFTELMASEASLGLRRAFLLERAVGKIPGMPTDMVTPRIEFVAVIGAGTMGTGIAIAMLNGGLHVTLIEASVEALARSRTQIESTLMRDAQKGRISNQEAIARIAQLHASTMLADVALADLVVEAVFEDISVKEQVFREIDRIAKPSAILASNTSFLNIDKIADFTSRPSRVLGLHFFSPANIMRLLEIVRGRQTSVEVLGMALALAKRLGKIGVIAGVCDGFIGNRIFEEYVRQAMFLVEEGASPAQVDGAMEAWGMAMGPFRTLDLAGQDIAFAVRHRRAVEQPDRPYSSFLDKVAKLGRYGQKTGKGIYDYSRGRGPEIDPEIDALLIRHREDERIETREVADGEIIERCLLIMANEGAKVVEENIAYRAIDIDVVYLCGYGFPAARGGPMFQADQLGLPHVLERLRSYAQRRHGWAFEPAELIVDLAADGRNFASLC